MLRLVRPIERNLRYNRLGIRWHSSFDDGDLNAKPSKKTDASPFVVCLVIATTSYCYNDEFGGCTTFLVCLRKANNVCVIGDHWKCLIYYIGRQRASVKIARASCVGI